MEKLNLNALYGLICIITIFSGLLVYSLLNPLQGTNQGYEQKTNQNANLSQQQNINRTFSFKAAIIDHLSESDPSPWFIEIATNILKAANFTVRYYPRDQVTIDLYRKLATLDYGLIIFRVHSGREPITFFFSGEPYNATEYGSEQQNGEIGQGWVPGDETTYFSIRPSFIQYAMKGSFYKTVIIAMGCGSLRTTEMAEAFVEKGAAVYIGWNASLTAFRGDLATLSLINHLLLERKTLNEAVDAAMKEVRRCPATELGTISTLSFYPIDSENYAIPYSINTSQTSNP